MIPQQKRNCNFYDSNTVACISQDVDDIITIEEKKIDIISKDESDKEKSTMLGVSGARPRKYSSFRRNRDVSRRNDLVN